MEIKTVSLIGLGALGILFGQRMAQHLPSGALRVVADRERIARYTRDGVFCNGERCAFCFAAPEEPVEPADLLLFAVKANGLEAAIEAARGHVGPNTIVLSLLNGISSEEIIARAYDGCKILLSVAQGMDAVKVGNRLTCAHAGMICFGEDAPNGPSPEVQAVAAFFDRVGIAYEIPADMNRRLWGKFMLNVGVNQTAAVYGCDYGGLQEEGPARDLMGLAMEEVLTLAPLEGVRLTQDDLRYWLGVLSRLNPGGKPSMQQDVEAGRPTEVALFAGTVLALAAKHGVAAPVNRLFRRRMEELSHVL